jgi:hypothetical protein
MNRIPGLTGLLAAGAIAFMLCAFVTIALWFPSFSAEGRGLFKRLGLGILCLATIGMLVSFVRHSLKAHLKALWHNRPLTPTAWRGAVTSYFYCATVLGFSAYYGFQKKAGSVDNYLYAGLAIGALILSFVSISRSLPPAYRDA